ncbi:MAG: hypothetical protein OXC94_07865 [Chloroflexi bacterium]|nr:hypothetical protein [Chloroflexota bacterium]
MTSEGRGAGPAGPPAANVGLYAELARELITDHAEKVRQLHAEHARLLVALRTELDAQRGELEGAQQQIQVLSGRTERHEAGQMLARDATRELEALRERLEAEAAQRRELATRMLAFIDHERSEAAEHASTQQAFAERLQVLEGTSQIAGEQLRRLREGSAGTEAAAAGAEERLAAIERELAVEGDAQRRTAEQFSQLVAQIDALRVAGDEIQTRLGVLGADQRRLGEDVGALRGRHREDTALLEAVDQQRVHRQRLEARLAELEEQVARESARLDSQKEALALARGEVAGLAERLQALGGVVEGQREAVLDHVRRSARAQEQTARRHTAELDREVRVANELITRLAEAPMSLSEEQGDEGTGGGAADGGGDAR